MNKNRYIGMMVIWLLMLGSGYGLAAEGLKVICASRAEKAPVIDGVLDDACWQKTEVRTDFTSPGDGQVLKRTTAMRVVYDGDHLYFGFEVFWDDAELLKKGIAAIRAKHPQTKEWEWLKEWNDYDYTDGHGLEVFLDAGVSGRNYYQMLFNAAGQCVGNYKCLFECFNIKPVVKGVIRGNSWTVEMAYPAKGLKAGQEWGLNVCRNDEANYGIWKQVGGNYHNPNLFGRLVIGDYREWWAAAGGKDTKSQWESIKGKSGDYARLDPGFKFMVEEVGKDIDLLGQWAEQYPPVNRENFERLYERYSACRDKIERLKTQNETLQLLAAVK